MCYAEEEPPAYKIIKNLFSKSGFCGLERRIPAKDCRKKELKIQGQHDPGRSCSKVDLSEGHPDFDRFESYVYGSDAE